MVYGLVADEYRNKGWRPFPVARKAQDIPKGVTGRTGSITDDMIDTWKLTRADDNVALRLEGVVAIDVDHYGDKRGGDTLDEYAMRLGPLPATFSCTARGKGQPSRQHYFRVPEGEEYVGKIGSDIDILQRKHRYAVVGPSMHPGVNAPYTWYDWHGEPADIPHIDMLAELPQAWADELGKEPDADLLSNVAVEPWRKLAQSFSAERPCAAGLAYRQAFEEQKAVHIGHDETFKLALRGFMLGREGHAGVPEVLTELLAAFTSYLEDKPGRRGEAEKALKDAAELAQRKVISDPCSCPPLTYLDFEDPEDEDEMDEDLKAMLARPLTIPTRGNGTKLDLEAAAAHFTYEHPVKMQGSSASSSTTAVYVWTGGRWTATTRLEKLVYRWLAGKLQPVDFTPKSAKELAEYIAYFAEETDGVVDPRYISVENGLLDWRTGDLIPRVKSVFVVNHLPVKWNPTAKPGRFQEWLNSAIDVAQRDAIWEILGYAISPVHDLKVALALTGPGGGGKSTLVNVMTGLVGVENCTAVPPAQMGARFNRAELFGAALNAAGDVGAEKIGNIGEWKSIVAGDEIMAERKGKDPFRFRPRAFNVASFNVLPETDSTDAAFWDRWLVLKFQRRFNRTGATDNYFRDVMPYTRAIREGILVGAVEGLRRLRDRGGFDSDVFGQAKDEWRADVDTVANFIVTSCQVANEGETPGKALYGTYRSSVLEGGGKPLTKPEFFKQLTAYLEERHHGKAYKRVSSRNIVSFVGLKVVLDVASEGGAQSADHEYGRAGWATRV